MIPTIPEGKILIQFDGICILCSRSIKMVLKADRKRKFVFQTLQQSGENKIPETIIVTHNNSTYEYFDAILKIGNELGGVYKVVSLFKILPKSWRLSLYLWVAKNRYKWIGKRNSCYLPTPKEQHLFL